MNLSSNKKGRAFKDLTIEQRIYIGSTAVAFTEGKKDYTVGFASGATLLQNEGKKFVIVFRRKQRFFPSTAFSSKPNYIEKHPGVIQNITKPFQKGLYEVQKLTLWQIAEIVPLRFPETSLENIIEIMTR